MRTSTHKGKKRVIIDPGEYYVTGDDEIISTLLGSCVAACLWDPVSRVIGMNHFLLVNRRIPDRSPLILSEAGRYGIHAMELLINAMLKRGADKRRLQAKAFGGGNVVKSLSPQGPNLAIGQLNSQFIMEFLRNEHIPLISSSLGGEVGRIIHFTANDFSVYMKTITTRAEDDLVRQEQRYLQQQIRERNQQKKRAAVQIW